MPDLFDTHNPAQMNMFEQPKPPIDIAALEAARKAQAESHWLTRHETPIERDPRDAPQPKSLNDLFADNMVRKLACNDLRAAEVQADGTLPIVRPSAHLYQSLPDWLRRGVDALAYETDKEVFLFGALGCVSAVLPNVTGTYNGLRVYPNLYVYLLGSAGSGKGKLEFARRLVLPIHQRLQKASNHERSLFIAANTSSSKAIRELELNHGRGLFFETEGDTMANAFGNETGDYSDTFRKAFHHEPVSMSRVLDNLKIYIESPRLSAVLSSTFGQLRNLVPSIENGLFSRFLFHEIVSTRTFINPFAEQTMDYEALFEEMGERLVELYEYLQGLELPLVFRLTEDQIDFFAYIFQHWKDEMSQFVQFKNYQTDELDAVVHRLGLMSFRLAMLLTTLRRFENQTLAMDLVCSDLDFYNALRIVALAKNNVASVFLRLPRPRHASPTAAPKLSRKDTKAQQYEQVRVLHQMGKTMREIATAVFGDESKYSTVHRWIHEDKE